MVNLSSDNLKIFLKESIIRILTFNYLVVRRIIKREYAAKSSIKILDLGCGTGVLANIFDSKNYTGVDLDRKLISYAKAQHPDYRFEVIDSTDLKKLNQKFDFVLIVGVVHHLNPIIRTKTIKAIRDVLKKNGYVLAIEAIEPIDRINFIGKILRDHDEGHHIISMRKYSEVFSRYFNIIKSFKQRGGLLDYGVFLLKN